MTERRWKVRKTTIDIHGRPAHLDSYAMPWDWATKLAGQLLRQHEGKPVTVELVPDPPFETPPAPPGPPAGGS
jgi:hypothetical protein